MKEKKKADIPFMIGLTILILVIGLMAGFFWQTVARQAEEERREELRRQEEERQEAVQAIVAEAGDALKAQVFVNLDTEEIFTCSVPKEGIYNRNGVLVPGDALEYGDMVRIYGGTMSDDGILGFPVLNDPERMERTGRADLHFAQTYQDLVDARGSD